MAKHKFDSVPLPNIFLIGISSHVNDYRLCWALNKSLGIDLGRRKEDLRPHGSGQAVGFAAFDHVEEETQAMYSLLSNHAPDGVLLGDQRHADYFLLVDEECSLRPGEALTKVRQAEFVLTAFPLDIKTIKDAYKLLE